MVALINNLGGTLGFGENVLSRNDDSYQSGVDLTGVFGSTGLNFFGTSYIYANINNNGNITLSNSPQGLSTFTPFGMISSSVPIIAPFFADIDTRLTGGIAEANQVTPTPGGTSQGSDLVWYDLDNINKTLTVTWDDVGYYSSKTDKLNAFQLQITQQDSSRFGIAFRYESINWTTGDASNGSGGLGGYVARAGYSTGDGVAWRELPQSTFQDQVLALDQTAGNTGVTGFYQFTVNGGTEASETIDGTIEDDILAGAGGNDVINGLAGNDYLIGNAGSDTLAGGEGDDVYTVDGHDAVREGLNAGNDLILSNVTFTLPKNVESLRLTGTDKINGTGSADDNILAGNSADNILDGKAGSDTVDYSLGTGAITIDLALTAPQYVSGLGSDKLLNIENIIGSIYDDTLTGNDLSNTLKGGVGKDTLNGGVGDDLLEGGASDDSLTGGDGTDIFLMDGSYTGASGVDTITDFTRDDIIRINGASFPDSASITAGDGTSVGLNQIQFNSANNVISIGLDSTAGADISIILTGTYTANQFTASGTDIEFYIDPIEGTDTNNKLLGTTGRDILDGGLGADIMTGGTGSDTYVIDTKGDKVIEKANEGFDTVKVSLTTFDLSKISNVENLSYTGNEDFIGLGNKLSNMIRGNSGDDILDGGAGDDYLYGGDGDDIYYIRDDGDIAYENPDVVPGAQGGSLASNIDKVISSISYALASSIENLELAAKAGSINGTGNSLDNIIKGNSKANILSGYGGNDTLYGGLGKDTLLGGEGADTFVFNTKPAKGNVDKVLDFSSGTDKVQLDVAIFTKLVGDNDLSDNFGNITLGGKAATLTQYILYEAATGNFYYDADGSGKKAAVLVGVFDDGNGVHPTLTFSDFIVV